MHLCVTFFQDDFLTLKLVLVTKLLVIRPGMLTDITLDFGRASLHSVMKG